MTEENKPFSIKTTGVDPEWKLVDAKDQILGRLATAIATELMGKNKPNYVPNMMTGNGVVVINARDIKLTGAKAEQKDYRRHSGRLGKLKIIPYKKVIEDTPERVIQHAVKGMLPKNKLGSRMLKRLRVYAGADYPHQAQIPG